MCADSAVPRRIPNPLRHLVVVLGDQLDEASTVFEGFDPGRDAVWMAEVVDESTRVWSHKARIAMFLAAMRHFAKRLADRGWTVHYRRLDAHDARTLPDALAEDLAALMPRRVVLVRPGEHRLVGTLRTVVEDAGATWSERPDTHFYCDPDDFAEWARGRRSLRMEHFYRWIRRREQVLLDDGAPAGGQWNFDASNRGHFGRSGPGPVRAPAAFTPDALTREVLDLVQERFAGHPGRLDSFDWPLTPEQAESALADFIRHRLADFGRYQDAIWEGETWLYHSRLSAAMNLKLLSPRRVVDAAVAAFRDGQAPIESVEGFVRQVIGWREFVRGVYWLRMPGFADENALEAGEPLPGFYWDGDTDMACLREAIGQTLAHGYAHHIQRLMVTGLFALLVGVRPAEVHAWYLAIYVDAVEWVELPNVLGMSQYADGGLMVSKPYAASGRYIQKMSNHCRGCRFDPGASDGERACPFTVLYWDFLDRHRERFADHPRAALQWRSLERIDHARLQSIRERAHEIRTRLRAGSAR